MRLIDADATIQMAERVVPKNHLHWLSFFIDEVVEEMPIIDAEPIKHGKWKVIEYEYFTCSECGGSVWSGCESKKEALEKAKVKTLMFSFCPHCGAKMEVGE